MTQALYAHMNNKIKLKKIPSTTPKIKKISRQVYLNYFRQYCLKTRFEVLDFFLIHIINKYITIGSYLPTVILLEPNVMCVHNGKQISVVSFLLEVSGSS
jgi:hypothetical protein